MLAAVSLAILLGLVGVAALNSQSNPPAEVAEEVDPDEDQPEDLGDYPPAEPSGYFILASTSDGIQRVDPETAVVEDLGIQGGVMGVLGDRLIIRGAQDLYIVPMRYFAGTEPIDLGSPLRTELPAGTRIRVGSNKDAFWLTDFGMATEFDANTGAKLREVRIDPERSLGPWNWNVPEYTTPSAGGVYRLDDDGLDYERVMDGRAWIASHGLLLVQQCDEFLVCSSGWFDAETLEPRTDLAEPTQDVGWFVGLFGNGQILFESEHFVNTRTGERSPIPEAAFSEVFGNEGQFDIAPDGSFVASLINRALYVQRPGDSERRRIDLPNRSNRFPPVFIPKPSSAD